MQQLSLTSKAAETNERMRELARGWREETLIATGRLALDPGRFQAFLDGVDCELTPAEFALAYYVARTRRSVTRSEIGKELWAGLPPPSPRSIAVKMISLRRKLAVLDPGTAYIHGVWKQGYRLEAKPAKRTRTGTPATASQRQDARP
jgi:DNA-binding response OmpR family regulator